MRLASATWERASSSVGIGKLLWMTKAAGGPQCRARPGVDASVASRGRIHMSPRNRGAQFSAPYSRKLAQAAATRKPATPRQIVGGPPGTSEVWLAAKGRAHHAAVRSRSCDASQLTG